MIGFVLHKWYLADCMFHLPSEFGAFAGKTGGKLGSFFLVLCGASCVLRCGEIGFVFSFTRFSIPDPQCSMVVVRAPRRVIAA